MAWTPGSGAPPAPPSRPPSRSPSSHGAPSSAAGRKSRAAALPQAGDHVGVYRVEGELGRGGMGAVFRVRHVHTGAEYALKVILSGVGSEGGDAVARFQREADVLARLDHPGIVRFHSLGVDGDLIYSVMELVDGETLQARLKREPLEPSEAASTIATLARSLAYAHELGVIHRDLKPANVLLDPRRGPRLLDFGLARLADGERLTRTGTALGTPEFMAPEQFEETDRARMGPNTDVYGLGALLYALLTGEPPFGSGDRVNLMVRVLTRYPDPPSSKRPGVPDELEAICLRALEKETSDRYPSAAALADDLERFVRGEPVEARPLGGLSRRWRRWVPARGPRRMAAQLVVFGLVPSLVVGALLSVGYFVKTAQHEASEADEAERQAILADLDARFDAVIVAGELPDRAAVDEVRGLARRLEKSTGDSEHLERARVFAGFEKLASGDVGFLRLTIPQLETPGSRWQPYAPTVVAILVHAKQARALALLVDRLPGLLALEETEAAVEELAIALGASPDDESGIEATAALVEAVDTALVVRAERGGDRAKVSKLRAQVLARRLAYLAPSLPGDGKALDELRRILDRTVEVLAQEHGELELGAEERTAIFDLARRFFESYESDPDGRLVTGIAEIVTLISLDEGQHQEISESLLAVLAIFTGESDEGLAEDERERQFRIGELLHRLGSWIFDFDGLVGFAPKTETLRRWAREERDRASPDPHRLFVRIATLYERRVRELRADVPKDEQRTWNRQEAIALVELWEFIGFALDRRGELPPQALTWLAYTLDQGVPLRDRELLDDDVIALIALLGRDAVPDPSRRGPADERARRAFVLDVIDGIHLEAFERNGERPPEEQDVEVFRYYADWLFTRSQAIGFLPQTADEIRPLVARYIELLDAAAASNRASGGGFAGREQKALDALDLVVDKIEDLTDDFFSKREPKEPHDLASCPNRAFIEELGAKVREVAPHNGESFEISAMLLEWHGDLPGAIELLRAGVDAERGTTSRRARALDVQLHLARLLAQTGQVEETRVILEMTERLCAAGGFEPRAEPVLERARIREQIGDVAGAAADRSRAKELRLGAD